MNSAEERKLATEEYRALVYPFTQGEDLCKGYVSWWIRKAAKGKGIWSKEYFEYFEEANKYIANEHNPELKGRPKAVMLQKLFYDNDDDREYITQGKRDGRKKQGKLVLNFVRAETASLVASNIKSNDAGGITEKMKLVAEARQLATISIKTTTTAHALGLACNDGSIYYFDPNLGEIQFYTIEELCDWWETCYLDKENKGEGRFAGAFKIMMDLFNINYYSPIG